MLPRRFNVAEPAVMLVTVLQWLVLASVAGVVVGSGTSLFLLALYAGMGATNDMPLWGWMLLLPVGGLINGLLLHYGYKAYQGKLNGGLMAAVHRQDGNMPLITMAIKPVAAVVTLASGGS